MKKKNMKIFKSKHYTNDPVMITFVESWFSSEYYCVYWKWAKPSSLIEKIFGCRWHKIRKYDDIISWDYNDPFQWSDKTYQLSNELVNLKHYVDKNTYTYQQMADYFGITRDEKIFKERKRRHNERMLECKNLRKQL